MDMKYPYLPRLVSNLYTIYFTQGPICENVSFNCKLELTKTRCLKAIKNRNIFIERNLVNKHKSCREFFIYFFYFMSYQFHSVHRFTYAGNCVRSRWYRLHTMRSHRCRLIKLVNSNKVNFLKENQC